MSKQIFWISLAAVLAFQTGCSNLPGTKGQQGAVIGGAGGAVAGAAIGGKENRLLGALIGGAVGAGGGYLVGANSDRIMGRDEAAAQQAIQDAQSSPATVQQARNAITADLNGDGFVTLDEVVAMRNAGLADQQMLDRLRATNQIFELTDAQRQYLRDSGVSETVVAGMTDINRDVRQRLLRGESRVISQPAPPPQSYPTTPPPPPLEPVPPPPPRL
jgi:hypothetical protein